MIYWVKPGLPFACGLGLLACMGSSLAVAQTVLQQSAAAQEERRILERQEQLQQRLEEEQKQRQRKASEEFAAQDQEPIPNANTPLPAEETPCFPIQRVVFAGVDGAAVPGVLLRGLDGAIAQRLEADNSKQKNVGGSISFGTSGLSGSVSASGSKIRSDYHSVVEQSGLRAGVGGFDVHVGGDTTLIGRAITSTQAAVQQNSNRFDTPGTGSGTQRLLRHAQVQLQRQPGSLHVSRRPLPTWKPWRPRCGPSTSRPMANPTRL